jgi:nucleoside diphosphate kinase
MFGPSVELASRYAESLRNTPSDDAKTSSLLADYVEKSYGPDEDGKPRRVMLLLLEGEDAVAKVWKATGSSTLRWGKGETIRDTFGDYIEDGDGHVTYFEPAVLVGPSVERTAATLRLWGSYSSSDGGIIGGATDVATEDTAETTLVLLKPDNFKAHTSRPGSVIDILSLSGLRIVGAKKFRMTVSQAEEFYGPVRTSLKAKLKSSAATRAEDALKREFGVEIPKELAEQVGDQIGPLIGEREFENIVHFMTGHRPSECEDKEKKMMRGEECLALVYSGVRAVDTIRGLLGQTDPAKARPGSVRGEFGSNIMVNTAHASDSPENAIREIRIVDVAEDTVKPLIDKHYGGFISRMLSYAKPEIQYGLMQRVRNLCKREETTSTPE